VQAPIERAFQVFTEGMPGWWPSDHHILEGELAEMEFEPRRMAGRMGCLRARPFRQDVLTA
jgi:hypothetical protein